MFKQNHAAMLGLILLIIITFGAIVGPLLHPTDPFEMVWAPFSPPEKRAFYLGRIISGVTCSRW